MFGPPKKTTPTEGSNIVYPEKRTQEFISIKINVSKSIRAKSNGSREKFEAYIKLSLSHAPSPSRRNLPTTARRRPLLWTPARGQQAAALSCARQEGTSPLESYAADQFKNPAPSPLIQGCTTTTSFGILCSRPIQ
jgi:hypothetical protein